MVQALASPVERVRAVEPRVRLVAWTRDPYGLTVASARTCYASEFVFVGSLGAKGEKRRLTLDEALPGHRHELDEVGRADTTHARRIELVTRLQKEATDESARYALAEFAELARRVAETNARIAHSIYEAGHHTPFQHPTFVFAIEGVSRNLVESFLHNHTFYNSEQQSQRYVEMREAAVHVPLEVAAHPEARRVYEEAVAGAWHAYHLLREGLTKANTKVMTAIGHLKDDSAKRIQVEAERKAQEMARYVVPICAQTQLYHTVSGIVLMRYLRMVEAGNASSEAQTVVELMVEEVRQVDAAFLAQAAAEPRPHGEHPEWKLLEAAAPVAPGPVAELLRATPDAQGLVVDALREVTGSTRESAELLATVMDPRRNPAWNDTLNTWDHSPVLRTLRHVHYTFRKRLSLTAYAQDQRHRMTPGSRPLLEQCLTPEPCVHVPEAVAGDAAAKGLFDEAIASLWRAMAELERLGIGAQARTYLLPNATYVHYTQSGDLLSFIHKWRLRLCFNAQREIYDASLQELRQVQQLHPELTRYIGPPCTFVAAAVPAEQQGSVPACCPEAHWCGVKVWQNFDAAKGTPKRPY
ncbi:MAG: FAD-dependent thymidylate synthase [Thermoplasmatota archaeon]